MRLAALANMRILGCLLLVMSACVPLGDDDEDEEPEPIQDSRNWGDAPGVRAIAGFRGDMVGDHGRPMAVGGARASVRVGIAATAPNIGGLRSSDPSIFEVSTGAAFPRTVSTTLMSYHSGTADLILYDHTGAEIDRTPVTVADSTTLALDEEWTDAMPTILAGSLVRFHVTPTGRDRANHDVALVGTGSVSFQATGAITQQPMSVGNDDTLVQGALGDGTVIASSLTTSLEVPVHSVAATALTAIDAPDAITTYAIVGALTVTIRAGTARVLGAYCIWHTPPGVSIGSTSALTYRVDGPVGTSVVTCVAPNGLTKTITLTLH